MRKAVYQGGLLEGASVDYDAEGSVVQACVYRANLLHGPLRRYWPDGTLMEEVHYQDGKLVGAPARFDAKGRRTGNHEATPALLERIQKLVRGQ